jgi:hypothetical protein
VVVAEDAIAWLAYTQTFSMISEMPARRRIVTAAIVKMASGGEIAGSFRRSSAAIRV